MVYKAKIKLSLDFINDSVEPIRSLLLRILDSQQNSSGEPAEEMKLMVIEALLTIPQSEQNHEKYSAKEPKLRYIDSEF